ncbi:MAG: DUF6285 domain-containing protein [Rhodospirillales bacterium]|nr:DUF6285 domain-containing protein [Rhodospirillales bacterium]
MRDQPSGANLLRQARAVLLEDLLGALPEGKRYEALMVANAMAIVARELEAGEGRAEERAALENLLGAADEADETAALKALVQRLAREIRTGRHDGSAVLHALLSRDAARRLAVSNPKRLDR